MAIRLITYDLNKETTSEDYKSILSYIKEHDWARLSESSYAIETTKTPKTVYGDLEGFLDAGDDLLVLTLSSPYSGIHRKEVVEWLASKLT
jgi:hypothetical protein